MGDSSQENWRNSSYKEGLEPLSPTRSPSMAAGPGDDLLLNEYRQAKRARVENIIRGMAGSPKAWPHPELERCDTHVMDSREALQEENWMQTQHSLGGGCVGRRISSIKEEECYSLRQQLKTTQRLLKQLQERLLHVDNSSQSELEDGQEVIVQNITECCNSFLKTELLKWSDCPLQVYPDSLSERSSRQVRMSPKQTTQTDNMQNKSDWEILEVLKHELSRAICRSVDLVFKNFSSAQFNQDPQLFAGNSEVSGSSEASCTADVFAAQSLDFYRRVEKPNPEDQPEALSLVICKPYSTHLCSMDQMVKKPHEMTQLPLQLKHNVALQNQILENILKYSPHGRLPSADRSLLQPLDLPWPSSKAHCKLNSSHKDPEVLETHAASLGQERMRSACFPQVKMKYGNLHGIVERNSYLSLNEGLTPNHLKKAKLMFFYTRYPSSNVLKSFFPDVKFNRCVTSQLIKWFSNFREFYYIQMEKFARQAILDGVGSIRVARDSELFRVLNMHYNKANDFQVPERFLEVAEITLKEFFNAILQAKDTDPSWKKSIYKIICKLDSKVPDYFKSFACS